MLPWLANAVKSYGVTGRAYLSISPATRQPELIGDVPVGLPDGAYLGEAAAAVLAEVTAVPFDVGSIPDVARWRSETLRHLTAAADLELISVWSPTFLLRLLDYVADPAAVWPRLKLLSCWASGASQPFAAVLAARLPHAHLQPKGLLSTECVVTVPDAEDRPVLTPWGFFEFEQDERLHLVDELSRGSIYTVVATTASGLYRYRTGDLVRYDGPARSGRPVLEFVGRGELASDLVGEKLTEPFVTDCLKDVPGFRLLVPDARRRRLRAGRRGRRVRVYRAHRAAPLRQPAVRVRSTCSVSSSRCACSKSNDLFDRYANAQLQQGVRLGDDQARCSAKRARLDRETGRIDHEDRADLAQGTAVPAPRRHFQEVAALPAAHAHDARSAGAAGARTRRSRYTTRASRTCPTALDADLIGMTVITGTRNARVRACGSLPRARKDRRARRAARHAPSCGSGVTTRTRSWSVMPTIRGPSCCATSRAEPCGASIGRRRISRSTGLTCPLRGASCSIARSFLTQAVFEATRSCGHDCEFCVAPAAWGRKQFQKPVSWVIEDIRRVGDRRILFIDLNLISNKTYATELFTALVPLNVRWFGLSTVLDRPRSGSDAAHGPVGLPRASARTRDAYERRPAGR